MTAPTLPPELEGQAAAYALGALDADDRVMFEIRLALDRKDLRAATRQLRAVASRLWIGVNPVSPRPFLRERMLAHMADEAQREAESFDAVADQLAFGAKAVTPPALLRERLLRGLGRQQQSADVKQTFTFVRAAEGRWQMMAPGVMAKVLYFDPRSRRATALVRMTPGSRYAPHRHAEAEEIYVLEGGCLCGGQALLAGDYHRAESGTEHHDTSSDDGCLLLLIASPQNELLR